MAGLFDGMTSGAGWRIATDLLPKIAGRKGLTSRCGREARRPPTAHPCPFRRATLSRRISLHHKHGEQSLVAPLVTARCPQTAPNNRRDTLFLGERTQARRRPPDSSLQYAPTDRLESSPLSHPGSRPGPSDDSARLRDGHRRSGVVHRRHVRLGSRSSSSKAVCPDHN
jgi:hypothetical protein